MKFHFPDSVPGCRRQRGSVLIVSLIMLVVMTLLAVSAIRLSTVNLRNVNGAQIRSEATSAASRQLDQFLNTNFVANIAAIVAASPYTVVIDSGKSYNVTVATPCLKQRALIPVALLPTDPTDPASKCRDGAYSRCENTVWQMSASVSDLFSGANAQVIQGVGIRLDTVDVQNALPITTICP